MGGTRNRRSSLEAREVILAAAERQFTVHGYAGTKSRDVAGEAGVSESVMYRHFGSKSGLFAEAVLSPFIEFLDRFSDVSARFLSQPLDDEVMIRLFVSELVDQLTEHRAALRTFLAASEDLDDEVKERFYAAFDEVMRQLGRLVETEHSLRDHTERVLGSEMDVRASIGMVLALVVLDDWLLPPGDRRPTREQLIEHVGEILLHGT